MKQWRDTDWGQWESSEKWPQSPQWRRRSGHQGMLAGVSSRVEKAGITCEVELLGSLCAHEHRDAQMFQRLDRCYLCHLHSQPWSLSSNVHNMFRLNKERFCHLWCHVCGKLTFVLFENEKTMHNIPLVRILRKSDRTYHSILLNKTNSLY